MSLNCTRCAGTGFLNSEQIPGTVGGPGTDWHASVLAWMYDLKRQMDDLGGCRCCINPPCSWCMLQHDVQVCDCCGDGKGDWHGEPGEHGPGEPAECA